MSKRRELPDKRYVNSYSQAAKAYNVPLKCIYAMQRRGVLDTQFTVDSHDRLRLVIVPLWGSWDLLRGQISKLKFNERLALLFPPPSDEPHIKRTFEHYRKHYQRKTDEPLKLESVIQYLRSFYGIVPPIDAKKYRAWISDLKKARHAAQMAVRREEDLLEKYEDIHPRTSRGKRGSP